MKSYVSDSRLLTLPFEGQLLWFCLFYGRKELRFLNFDWWAFTFKFHEFEFELQACVHMHTQTGNSYAYAYAKSYWFLMSFQAFFDSCFSEENIPDNCRAKKLAETKSCIDPAVSIPSFSNFFNSCVDDDDEKQPAQQAEHLKSTTTSFPSNEGPHQEAKPSEDESNLELTSKPENSQRIFSWRKKQTNALLAKRYLDEGYVAKLVVCKYVDEYDNGKKPTCNEKCQHGCQDFFRNQTDVLKEELTEWWGEHSDSTLRKGMLYEDIKLGAVDGTVKLQRWYIRNKEVCKNFYLRARGAQKETVRK